MPPGGAAVRLAALLSLLAAASPAASGEAHTVGVLAPSSLAPVLPALVKAYEQAHPGAKIQLTVGSSTAMFGLARQGGPFDLFLSADRELPERIVASKLGDPAVVYAIGRLVIWTPPRSRLSFESSGLRGLGGRKVSRIAVANPVASPYGRATIAAFRAAGISEAIQGRIVLGQSALQTAELARTGGADVAILPAAVAAAPAFAKGKAVPVPAKLHPRIEQAGVVLSRGTEPVLAAAFLDLLTGPQGRKIMRKHGYELP